MRKYMQNESSDVTIESIVENALSEYKARLKKIFSGILKILIVHIRM